MTLWGCMTLGYVIRSERRYGGLGGGVKRGGEVGYIY